MNKQCACTRIYTILTIGFIQSELCPYLQSSPPVLIKYLSSKENLTLVTWAECPTNDLWGACKFNKIYM